MFVVLFEVEPFPDQWDAYLAHAASLRPELERMDGFLDNKRYTSRRRPGWLLSVSSWRDEKSLVRWRTHAGHHAVQDVGRQSVFRDYRIRVGEVAGPDAFEEGRVRLDHTEIGTARAVSLMEDVATDPPDGVSGWDRFDGITVPGSAMLLLEWSHPNHISNLMAGGTSRIDISVLREYGLRDRREAPQYHRPPRT